MQEQAESEIEKITRAAETEAAQLIAEAEEQARSIRARHRARIEPTLLTEAASLLNKAKLDTLRAAANGREQLLRDAFAQAEASLAEIRGSKEYPAIFRALAKEAVSALEGERIVRVDPSDAALARATLAQLGVDAAIETRPIPLGGLEVVTRDGREAVVNTLVSRLERARSVLRGPAASILAGESEAEWKTTTATPMPA
jgi:vacuolar-type H+-ATPase subunit E/Vma4